MDILRNLLHNSLRTLKRFMKQPRQVALWRGKNHMLERQLYELANKLGIKTIKHAHFKESSSQRSAQVTKRQPDTDTFQGQPETDTFEGKPDKVTPKRKPTTKKGKLPDTDTFQGKPDTDTFQRQPDTDSSDSIQGEPDTYSLSDGTSSDIMSDTQVNSYFLLSQDLLHFLYLQFHCTMLHLGASIN